MHAFCLSFFCVSLYIISSVFFFQLNLLMGVDAVFSAVERTKLPPQLGGTAQHNHQHWVNFRQVSQGVLKCRKHHFKSVISSLQGLIDSAHKHFYAHPISILHTTFELLAEKERHVMKTLVWDDVLCLSSC